MTENVTLEEKDSVTQVQAAKPTQRRTENREPLSIPVYRQTITLSSLQCQRVMTRSFAAVAGSLFRIDVILRIIGQAEHIDEVEEMIRSKIKALQDDIKKETSGADGLLKEEGITQMPEYTYPREYEIEIRSPQISNFTRLLTALDALLMRIDALWINGCMPNKQRSNATHQWQQRLLGLSSNIIGYEKRARLAARNAGKETEIETLAPISEQVEGEKNIAAEAQELAAEEQQVDKANS